MEKFSTYTRDEFIKNFPKIPLNYDKVTFHVSDSPRDRGDDAKAIDRWHRQRGFNQIGYHFLILPNGDVQIGRSLNLMGAHVIGQNRGNIGICFIGGWRGEDTRTEEQTKTMAWMILTFVQHGIKQEEIKGHRDYDKQKSCPNFCVQSFIKRSIGFYIF